MSLVKLKGVERYIPRLEPSLTSYIVITAACFLPAILWGAYVIYDIQTRQIEPAGCRKLGLRIQSRLADQHSEKYSGTSAGQGNSAVTWRVKSLWIYPVKSCRGVELNRATVIGTGMKYDRQFSFAQLRSNFPVSLDTPHEEKASCKWKFVTQRTFPAMTMIKTEVWLPDPSTSMYSKTHPNVQSGGVLVLKIPKLNNASNPWSRLLKRLTTIGGTAEHSVHIPFNPTPNQIRNNSYTTEQMEIWKDSPKSLKIASTESSDLWIQDLRFYLGITNHLAFFRVSKDDTREVYQCAPRKDELGYQPTVGFQDAYPLHILNLASVQDIGKKLDKSAPLLGALNFRPNIVITGGEPYAEDSWKRIKVGEYEYYVSCRTTRCLLPNVNPDTGVKHGSEPNKTLKTYRRIDEGDRTKACLGMHMVPALEESKIKVGDEIKVLATGEHFFIK